MMRGLLILVFTLFWSCSKESVVTLPSVYVAGVAYVPENFGVKSIATYWKNGSQVSLPGGAVHSYAAGIAVSDNKIYVVGNISDSTSVENPAIWINGALNLLAVPSTYNGKKVTYSKATGVALSGSDVYTCGFISNGATFYQAAFWKNGTISILPNGGSMQASAIAISNNDVYIAAQAGYWKNEIYQSLPNENPANSVTIFGMQASGTDVYLVGTTYNNVSDSAVATIWKNGSSVSYLTDNNFIYSAARAVAISGTDVYVTGSLTNDFSSYTGVYWKNNSLIELSGTGNNSPSAIVMNGSEIYIAGTVNASTSYGVYWHNNISVTLPNCQVANSIVVK